MVARTKGDQGYRLNGRTPAQALMEALNITELPPLAQEEPTSESSPAEKAA